MSVKKLSNRVVATAQVNVRASASGTLMGTQPTGATGTITSEPVQKDLDGEPVTWYLIQFDSPTPDPSGWCGDDNLESTTDPGPGPGPTPPPSGTPTHFVATTGSDSNPGTSPSQAWKTIGKAISGAPLGAVVQIASGTYNETLDFNRPATSATPLHFQTSGAVTVNGPIKLSGSYITVNGLKSGMKSLLNSGSNPPAFKVSGNNNVLSDCVIDGASWGGSGGDEGVCFNIDGQNCTLLRCQASNIDNLDSFRIFGTGNTIDGCVSFNHSNTRYSEGAHADYCQSWGGVTDPVIQNCLFYGAQGSPHQFGILNNGSSATRNLTWRNNIVSGSEHFFIFIRDSKIYNNLWYECAHSIGDLLFLDQNQYQPYVIKNNAFVNCGTGAQFGFIEGGIQGSTVVDYNFFSWGNNGPVSHGVGTHAVNGGDPKFVNPGARDFHTNSGSALRGKGVPISPAFPDKDGKNRPASGWDIGPYQA